MESNFKTWLKSVYSFFTNRFLMLFILFVFMLYTLVVKLFEIQIIDGSSYLKTVTTTTLKTVAIKAPRGSIYDSFGRPLAVNEIAFTVKINPNVNKEGRTETVIRFVKLMKEQGEKLTETFPIILGQPFTFDLNESETREKRWKNDMGIDENLNAKDSFVALRKFFVIPEHMSDEEAWDVLNVLAAIHMERYTGQVITIAFDINDRTVAALEEKKQEFLGISIDIDYLRKYPQGENFSHALGYIRKISKEELAEFKDVEGYSYNETSIVGKSGLEQSFELDLKGIDGEKVVEVDIDGRQVSIASSDKITLPTNGDNIITTIDVDMQNKAYAIIENMLKDILIKKLSGASSKEKAYTAKDVILSMTKANNISIVELMKSEENTTSNTIKNYVLNNFAVNEQSTSYVKDITLFIMDSIETNKITLSQMILVMEEQKTITLTSNQISLLSRGSLNVLSLLIEKLGSGEITPQMTNLDPCTGSVTLVDIKTGDTIVAASYPTYDNNELVNNFNNTYFNKINNDPTSPQIYRAFSSPIAPGSTFKMLTAIAGLETGVITEKTIIVDKGEFTDAGKPYIDCWIKTPGFHGEVDVRNAIEVSCNFFFNTVSYSFGNNKTNETSKSIGVFDKYINDFGLNAATGIEVDDYAGYSSEYKKSLATYKERIELSKNPEANSSELRWTDGNTVATAIGQYINNYTPGSMVKYISTIANGGNRYSLHFLDKVVTKDGVVKREYVPNLELKLDIKQENLKVVHEGMLRVTSGTEGTARTIFKDFPIKVAGKTGTAEEYGSSHSSFAGFAPYDNPQVAIYVNIPKGDTLTTSAPTSQVARDVLGEYFGVNSEAQLPLAESSLLR